MLYARLFPTRQSSSQARTNLAPFDLLATLKRIESDLGRLPSIRNGPRAIDLDILLFGQRLITHDNLVIPHASMLERGFVLQPLTEYYAFERN